MQNQFSHIIHMLKIAVKLVVSILYNGYKLIRFRSISFPFYIKKGLEVHKPSMIKLGRNVTIGRYARLACYGNSDTSLLTIEDNVYIGQYFTALVGGEISIFNCEFCCDCRRESWHGSRIWTTLWKATSYRKICEDRRKLLDRRKSDNITRRNYWRLGHYRSCFSRNIWYPTILHGCR